MKNLTKSIIVFTIVDIGSTMLALSVGGQELNVVFANFGWMVALIVKLAVTLGFILYVELKKEHWYYIIYWMLPIALGLASLYNLSIFTGKVIWL